MTEGCLNCGAPLMGKYCATCRQKDLPERPDVYHFLHEVLHEFLHLDGKIVRALKLLLFRPGSLTLEYWAGRRAAQVAPLRLYLMARGQTSFEFISDLLLALGIPVYGLVTFKKVFGLSWPSTFLRSAAVALVYFLIFVVTEVAPVAATLSSL